MPPRCDYIPKDYEREQEKTAKPPNERCRVICRRPLTPYPGDKQGSDSSRTTGQSTQRSRPPLKRPTPTTVEKKTSTSPSYPGDKQCSDSSTTTIQTTWRNRTPPTPTTVEKKTSRSPPYPGDKQYGDSSRTTSQTTWRSRTPLKQPRETAVEQKRTRSRSPLQRMKRSRSPLPRRKKHAFREYDHQARITLASSQHNY